MAEFKNENEDILIKDTRKMKLEVEGVLYKRVPKPKYLSRQARLDAFISLLKASDGNVDASELEKLSEEMENWRHKLEGTGLVNTVKYSEVVKCSQDLIKDVEYIREEGYLTRREIKFITFRLLAIYFPGQYT